MNDKELLELAAKAAGHEIKSWFEKNGVEVAVLRDGTYWQPLLKNDITDCMGDALRLAVKLQISPMYGTPCVAVCAFSMGKSDDSDPYAATRRAIVIAAAEIGKAMK